MKLDLVRTAFTTLSTIGELSIDGAFECYTLEDRIRDRKIYGKTAIREGSYAVALTHSPRFGKVMPLLLDVPEFEGIRIHPGNTHADTEGCILVGETKAVDFIGNSRAAYRKLLAKLETASSAGEALSIRIRSDGEPAGDPVGNLKEWNQVVADPLNFRAGPRLTASIKARLAWGEIVRRVEVCTGGWLAVVRQATGETGYVFARYLRPWAKEDAPESSSGDDIPVARATAAEILHAVDCSALRLRSTPNIDDDSNILLLLSRHHLVRKVAEARFPVWWKVAAKVHGENREGFVHSAYLREIDPGAPERPDATRLAQDRLDQPEGGALISDAALQLILQFEGIDQPHKWPGGGSGITLGVGYDLGYHSEEEFSFDWEPHLSGPHIEELHTAIGRRGRSAAAVAARYRGIHVTRSAAEDVFLGRTLPKYRAMAFRAFPGLDRLPEDAQGALVSLVFNRGPGMRDRGGSDRRKEMREVRAAVASGDLEAVADAITRMKRLWTGRRLRGLLRRRDAEAELVRSCL